MTASRINRRRLLQACAAAWAMPLSNDACGHTTLAEPRSFSLHIGVNRVDASKYPPITELAGCVRDATTYRQIAEQSRFGQSKLLVDEQATRREVLRHIYWAGHAMQPGDIFLLTYAGHGGQLPDRNGDENDASRDGLDETWCLYDGQLRDDLLHRAFASFAAGVRIVVISDSCHSGTVARAIGQLEILRRALESPRDRAIYSEFFDSPERLDEPRTGDRLRAAIRAAIERGGQTVLNADFRFRSITADQAREDYQRRRGTPDDYDRDEVSLEWGDARAAGQLAASGLLLAGCQDSEFSWESGGSGMFTSQLKEVFDLGVNSSYQEFLQTISSRMPSNQNPNFFPFGTPDEVFYSSQIPFTI